MHTHDLDISINKLSKIEGHADLDIKVRNGEVESVIIRVEQNKRFYTQAVEGKPASTIPQIVSRICGTCSIAHLLTCTEAVEKTLKVEPTPQTMLLKKLTMYSMMIRDHALHLYFFVMPDLYGVDSVLDLPDDKKELIHQALHIKEAGNNFSKLVAGRSVHALFPQVGGFSNIPDPKKIQPVIDELKSIRQTVIELCNIFYECDWELIRDTTYVALSTPDFTFLEGKIKSSTGAIIKEEDYWDHLHKVVVPYSQADAFKFEDKEYLVGSLARLNLNQEALHANTKKDLAKHLAVFPSKNIFHNNLAQAIEILHSIDHSIDILENTKFEKEEIIKPQRETGEGVGVIEAPRGTLYYWLGINDSKVRYANLVIPTAQNLINMQKDVRKMVKDRIDQGEKVIKKEAEKIIRAYDPCMSCASHFLKINWI
jgi:sulfhydrogenase subunit alpha